MRDTLITIFGGGGFLGRHITQHLTAAGARVRIAQRNIRIAQDVKPLGNLGQTQLIAADIRKPETVARAVHGADAVINLVGILKGDFDAFHHEGAANVARAAAAAGAQALVHVSAIGADAGSKSAYGRSKAEGEAAVRAAFPSATILRPSIVFGREDQFINRFAGLISSLPIVPIIGGKARFQPVYVDDVAEAVKLSLSDPARFGGRTFELGGPETISMAELNKRIAKEIGEDPSFIDMPDSLSGLMAGLTGWLPGAPITRDQWAMLQSDNVVAEGTDGLQAFGITPTPMAAVIGDYLVRFRKHGRFGARAKRVG
ncbi:MAG: 3-beta hydroxysteroid dehydrogenase [Sphingomonadales bacterium RIFCSPHIGHO2_01_FULL_65_20]|uniref:complex I NDUFA9 subunit family protein n=1 Tax=unclassified Blastomonas TaxID=2626550 RepID=UPI00082CCAA5|nr:complex I NDUFA9 subunit family protein [Blastomonas sp.]MCH2236335.1 complex I NDUFA9 subunit family protein [Blastomonas sp.]OHC94679.1 MAG: 3-beta hydroxysteroid dehydrogenase [Sphingomonadales bacterium RIFCSPHIGHO2_01_FULL_65_20]